MNRHHLKFLTVFLLCCSASVHADTYKCTNGSSVTYSQTPCSNDAHQSIIKAPPPVNDNEAQEAKQRAAKQEKNLDSMTKERHQLEAKREKEMRAIAKHNAAIKRTCDGLNLHVKWAQEDLKGASEKSSGKAKSK